MAVTGKKPSEWSAATIAAVQTAINVIDITYTDLVTAIGASGLVEGQLYKITDFATVHWMVDVTDGAPAYILDGEGDKIIHTGANEPIVVLATSENTLAVDAYSLAYPDDAIKYNWDHTDFTLLHFNDEGEAPAGFKGVITRREDTLSAIKTNYDFREITYRLWSIEQPVWAEQAYSEGDIVQVGTVLYGANATTESTDAPGDSAKWTFLIDITDNVFVSYSATSHNIYPFSITIQDTDDFTDRTMFDDDTCSNIVFEECNYIPYMTYGSNCGSMTYGSSCGYMTYGSECYYMTYGSECGKMTYGSNCGAMTYGSNCGAMTYGGGCYNMTYGSNCGAMTYGGGCYNMTYGSNCGAMTYGSDCRKMTYGIDCSSMTYGSDCGKMTYGNACDSMIYPDYTAYNDFKDGVSNIDFTGAGITQITNGTTITHQLSGLAVYQSYIDTSETPTMVITTNTIGVYVNR
jgi:hypothetical protein